MMLAAALAAGVPLASMAGMQAMPAAAWRYAMPEGQGIPGGGRRGHKRAQGRRAGKSCSVAAARRRSIKRRNVMRHKLHVRSRRCNGARR